MADHGLLRLVPAMALALGVIALAALATAEGGDWLSRFRWTLRPLVIVAPTADDPRLMSQIKAYYAALPQALERDMAVVLVTGTTPVAVDGVMVSEPTPLEARDTFGLDMDAFRVLLVGKDGGVKLERTEPVEMGEVFTLIDSMPMRRDEMRERRADRDASKE